jgi:hypothetical protein
LAVLTRRDRYTTMGFPCKDKDEITTTFRLKNKKAREVE